MKKDIGKGNANVVTLDNKSICMSSLSGSREESEDDDLSVEKKEKACGNIVILICENHSRLAATSCRFQGKEYISVRPVCDFCHRARLCDLKKYQKLTLMSHILRMKHFEVQLDKIKKCNSGSTILVPKKLSGNWTCRPVPVSLF